MQSNSRLSSQTHPQSSRHITPSPGPYVPQPEGLILPDVPSIGAEGAVELLNELVHHPEDILIDADDEDTEEAVARRRLPWWKRPSPWWQLAIVPLSAVAMSMTIAPRIEIYTLLACSVHKPDIFERTLRLGGYRGFPTETSPLLVLPPVIIANSLDHSNLGFSPNVPVSGVHGFSYATAQSNPCASDPVVQAAVATLTAAMTTVMGILTCLTTGWWGSFCDRYGRTRVLGITVFGLLLNDFNFIFVTRFFRHLPGNYWFLLVGPVVEGCVGGMVTASAAMHAYLADTTSESSRSRIFSLSQGLFFIGITFGPTLGGILIRISWHPLSVFYAATLIHFLYACMTWFIVPESLPLRQMELLRQKYMAEADERVRSIARAFAFLSPLGLLMPEVRGKEQGNGNPLKRRGRDWTLTLVAAAYGSTMALTGTYMYTFQYASSMFGWTSETLGYFISLIGAVRAVFLTIILPLGIKFFKRKPILAQPPIKPQPAPPLSPSPDTGSETQPLLVPASPTTSNNKIHKELILDSSHFDLALARVSLLVDIVSYVLLVSIPTAVAFTLGTVVGSMGSGFNPAVQSVALGLYRRRGGTESGKLFGALSVVQALCSQILGPAMYGLVYMNTVAIFPQAIFAVSIAMITIAFTLLVFVKLPKEDRDRGSRDDDDVEEDAEPEVVGGAPWQEVMLVDTGDSGNGEGTVLARSPSERSSST